MDTQLFPISETQPRRVEWLIRPFVPIGKLSLVVGQMGQAKSLLTCKWAADVSREGSALMYAVEDDDADTIRPRLEAAGADCTKVYVLREDSLSAQSLEDHCDQLGDVRLVTVDPLTAFFDDTVDPWKSPKVRRFLRPILEVAQRKGVAIVGLVHTNRWSDDQDPLAKIAEAQGIPQVSRSVMMLGPNDKCDPDRDKVLAIAKANLTREREAVAFRIETRTVSDSIEAPCLVEDGTSAMTAAEVLGHREGPAVEFLRDALSGGPREASEVEGEATAEGISSSMLKTAKRKLKVETQQMGFHGGWKWSLPSAV